MALYLKLQPSWPSELQLAYNKGILCHTVFNLIKLIWMRRAYEELHDNCISAQNAFFKFQFYPTILAGPEYILN